MDTADFPGCCSSAIVHEFPYDGSDSPDGIRVRVRTFLNEHLDAADGAVFATLSAEQKIAQSVLLRHGFKVVGTYPGNESVMVTVLVAGLRPPKKTAKKKARKK